MNSWHFEFHCNNYYFSYWTVQYINIIENCTMLLSFIWKQLCSQLPDWNGTVIVKPFKNFKPSVENLHEGKKTEWAHSSFSQFLLPYSVTLIFKKGFRWNLKCDGIDRFETKNSRVMAMDTENISHCYD